MKIAYVVGIALGELAQAKAVAFYTRRKGEQNIFIAKEPRLISSIEADGDIIETLSSFCYHPENLYRLVYGLGIQSEIDHWLPNEERTLKKMMDLTQISCLVTAFTHWIDEGK